MGDKIRVLSVSLSDSSGGAARAAYQIHLAVQDFGVESRMFVKHKGTSDSKVIPLRDFAPRTFLYRTFDWLRNKVKNHWQHYQWGKYPNKGPFFMSDLRSEDICGALKKIDYDILHLHWVNLRFLPLDKLPKDKPIVWTLHDSWPFCGVCHVPLDCILYEKNCGCCPQLDSDDKHDLSHKVWLKKQSLYRKLDLHVVAPSRWMAENARHSSLFKGVDIRVIPNCLDMGTFCPGNKEEACYKLGLDSRKYHVLFGAMQAVEDKNKGFCYLVDALERIGPALSTDTDLVVFGTSGPLPGVIGGMKVKSLGLLRSQATVVEAYRAADVTVVPSLSENLSCTIMESMACGTPVVAFNIGGNSDMIDHQVNGFLADEKDDESLADGIAWCLENNREGRLSEKARSKILDHHTSAIVGKQYAELYLLLAGY